MPYDEFEEYWSMISVIEAQEMLLDLRKHDWPHLQTNKREEFHRSISKQAYPESNKPMTLEEFIKNSSGGIGG